MHIEALHIPDIKLLVPKKFGDARGFFSETYNARTLLQAGVDLRFVQDNQSWSAQPGTIRGLHFQIEPHAQDKLVRVVRGAVFDVAVDLRKGSPTFGKHVSATLSATAWNQLLVPIGFAHGFCTLEPDTEVIYKVTDYYSQQHERGIRWDDPALGINWPTPLDEVVLNERDAKLPLLRDLGDFFTYKA
jgi:dTDP-4-dehydrorhamnose 3,5-epimerase